MKIICLFVFFSFIYETSFKNDKNYQNRSVRYGDSNFVILGDLVRNRVCAQKDPTTYDSGL